MLSAKTRKNHPNYCSPSHRGQYSHPFCLRRSYYSAKRGNFFLGAPGSLSILRKSKPNAERAFGTDCGNSSSKLRLSPVGLNVSSELGKKGAAAAAPAPRVAQRKAKGAVVQVLNGALAYHGKTHRKQRVPPTKNGEGQFHNPLKRCIRHTPRGMANEHTQHFRATMFGDDARNRMASKNKKPFLFPQASDGRLFHTVTNLPVDTELYNSGFDSDGDEDHATEPEQRWRRRQREDLINEFIDMEPVQKYFLSLWNHYVYEASAAHSDEDVFGFVLGFADKFGPEVKRMKLEVEFASIVTHMWKLGLMDASGVLQAMQAFRDCDSTLAQSGAPHPEFGMAHRLLREENITHTQSREYRGLQKISARVNLPKGMIAWVAEEELKSRQQHRAVVATSEAKAITRHWMGNVGIDA